MDYKKHQKINDQLRQKQDVIYLSKGVQQYSSDEVGEIMEKVRTFNDFTIKNDPFKEHDFGQFEYKGQTFMWKIDTQYPKNTPFNKYLVVMKAEEY